MASRQARTTLSAVGSSSGNSATARRMSVTKYAIFSALSAPVKTTQGLSLVQQPEFQRHPVWPPTWLVAKLLVDDQEQMQPPVDPFSRCRLAAVQPVPALAVAESEQMGQPILDGLTLLAEPRGAHGLRQVGCADRPDIAGVDQLPVRGGGDGKGHARLGKPVQSVACISLLSDLFELIAEALQFGVQPREPQLPAERPVPLDESSGDVDGRQTMHLHGETGRMPGMGSVSPRPVELNQAVIATHRDAVAALRQVTTQRTSYVVRRVSQAHAQQRAADDHVDEEVQISHSASFAMQPSRPNTPSQQPTSQSAARLPYMSRLGH
ncbi:hypothetical protein LQ51_21315 [Micromonospora sp. HK10]|nr:hypothetical protein LQ51_21315 [Micromonospora sp. HK10]